MTPRSSIRNCFLLLAVVSTCSAGAEPQIPAEVRALPPWAGEEAAAKTLPPHYVFRDATGQMVVSYAHPDNPGRRITYRFWLPNRVAPQMSASVVRNEVSGESVYTYAYRLRNDASASTTILQWSLVVPPNQELAVNHPAWKSHNAKSPVAPQGLLPEAPMGAFVVWLAVDVPRLSAGDELGGFTLRSRFAPGLTTAYASGEGVLEEPDGEFPEAVIQELIPLQRPQVWQKPFLTIGPRFAADTPWPSIREAFRKDLASLIKQGLLSSVSAYVRELEGVLGSTRSTAADVLARKASPQSPIEKDLDIALRMCAGITGTPLQ